MAEKAPGQARGLWIGLGVIALALIAFFYLRSSSKETVEIRTGKVSHADLASTVSTNGKVEPVEDFQPRSPAPGVVEKVFVSLGEHVSAGGQLMRLDASEARKNVAAARAALQGAEATLANFRNNGTMAENQAAKADLSTARMQEQNASKALTSLQTLQAKGSASGNEVESAKQRVADAHARVSQLETSGKGHFSGGDISAQEAQVAQARAALSAAQKAYSDVDIHAPFAGTIYSLPVGDYDFVNSGEALLNMADLTRIQIRAFVDEPEIGKLAVGQPVKIVWDAKPNAVWHGHIKQAPLTVIAYNTRSVGECYIAVDGAKGDLLPNTNVTITVTTSQKVGVLSVPREALHTDVSRTFVYRVVGDHLQSTPVQVGSINNTRVEITSGLSDGDTVALSSTNNADLKDGLQIKAAP